MKIKAVDADLSLGGDTFTGRLAQHCLQALPAASGATSSCHCFRFKSGKGKSASVLPGCVLRLEMYKMRPAPCSISPKVLATCTWLVQLHG